MNLYGFVGNDGANAWDRLGLKMIKYEPGTAPVSGEANGITRPPDIEEWVAGQTSLDKWSNKIAHYRFGFDCCIIISETPGPNNTDPKLEISIDIFDPNASDSYGNRTLEHERTHERIWENYWNNLANDANNFDRKCWSDSDCAGHAISYLNWLNLSYKYAATANNTMFDIFSYPEEVWIEHPNLEGEYRKRLDEEQRLAKNAYNRAEKAFYHYLRKGCPGKMLNP